jgi:hypothetical protein
VEYPLGARLIIGASSSNNNTRKKIDVTFVGLDMRASSGERVPQQRRLVLVSEGCVLTQWEKHAPPNSLVQLLLRETPKYSVNISSGFAIYDKDVTGWRTFYQLCHIIGRAH